MPVQGAGSPELKSTAAANFSFNAKWLKITLTHSLLLFSLQNELELEGVFSDRADNEVYPALRPPVENKGTVMAHGTEGVLYASDLRDEQVCVFT